MLLVVAMGAKADKWPDGTEMDAWFGKKEKVDVKQLGRPYVITDYGVVADSTLVQTAAIQRVIDRCADEGGGVIVIPEGTFLSGHSFLNKVRICM